MFSTLTWHFIGAGANYGAFKAFHWFTERFSKRSQAGLAKVERVEKSWHPIESAPATCGSQ